MDQLEQQGHLVILAIVVQMALREHLAIRDIAEQLLQVQTHKLIVWVLVLQHPVQLVKSVQLTT